MNAEIIAVGSELLLGQIVNTNARFISLHLAEMGINVYSHTVVGDNSNRLESAIQIAEKRADIILFTGGLGPTKDDLTKETIARHLGKDLVIDENAMASIESYFKKTNREMTENNRKQALILKDSVVLPNDHGMAPGMMLCENHRIYMLLPGPPKEMEPMFLHYGQKALSSQYDTKVKIISRVLRFFGIGESSLETAIEDLIDAQSNPTIAPLASDGEVTLRLTASQADPDMANIMLDKTEREIRSRVGPFFYGYDNTSLMVELIKVLLEKKLTIAVAESLTGGMFQQELTSVPGTSALLKGGVICYTKEMKQNVLKVKKETIEKLGVVSGPCACELAENVATLAGADIGISFTGVAGPDELEGKPAGTVYIGITIKDQKTVVEELHLGGTRDAVRSRTVKYGCFYLTKFLKEL